MQVKELYNQHYPSSYAPSSSQSNTEEAKEKEVSGNDSVELSSRDLLGSRKRKRVPEQQQQQQLHQQPECITTRYITREHAFELTLFCSGTPMRLLRSLYNQREDSASIRDMSEDRLLPWLYCSYLLLQ